MLKAPWLRSEKRLMWLSAILCVVPLVSSGFYEWNNRVPEVHLLPRVVPNSNAEGWFLRAKSLYVPPRRPKKGALIGLDAMVDEAVPTKIPRSYSAQYNQIYPLARKTAFLKANAPALSNLRRGLRLPYAYSLPGYAGDDSYWSSLRFLARLLIIESHARAQRGDWNGAADSLLDAQHLGYVTPTEAPSIALDSGGFQIRDMVRREFWLLLPHLSAQKLRDVARKIEIYRSQTPALAQSLSWNKRCRQETLLNLIRQRDLRLIGTGFPYACADMTIPGCAASQTDIEKSKKNLPVSFQLRLAWANKAGLMDKMTRHLDWQITQVKKPFPQRTKKWPRPNESDELDVFLRPNLRDLSLLYARNEAHDTLLATSLALRSFRLEKGRNPHTLRELVPRYLARVPLDPFSNQQTLRYQNQAKRFVVSETYEPIYASAPSQFNAPTIDGVSSSRRGQRFEAVPLTLYSIGHNARDDGGTPYEDKDQLDFKRCYKTDYFQSTAIPADIVAGINN